MIISIKRLMAAMVTIVTFMVLFLTVYLLVDRFMTTIHPAWATREGAYTVEVTVPTTVADQTVEDAEASPNHSRSIPINRLFYFWYHGE
ncbi:MAG: hypothetical protein RBR24_01510 [Candidatus Carbobacillus sp.]|nr:hypothetical protein [Candidatus Carbobacillus sp.]